MSQLASSFLESGHPAKSYWILCDSSWQLKTGRFNSVLWYLIYYQLHFAQWFPKVALSARLFNGSHIAQPAFTYYHPLEHFMTRGVFLSSHNWGDVCSSWTLDLIHIRCSHEITILIFEVWLCMYTESSLPCGICVLLLAISKEKQMAFDFRGSAHQETKPQGED